MLPTFSIVLRLRKFDVAIETCSRYLQGFTNTLMPMLHWFHCLSSFCPRVTSVSDSDKVAILEWWKENGIILSDIISSYFADLTSSMEVEAYTIELFDGINSILKFVDNDPDLVTQDRDSIKEMFIKLAEDMSSAMHRTIDSTHTTAGVVDEAETGAGAGAAERTVAETSAGETGASTDDDTLKQYVKYKELTIGLVKNGYIPST